MKREGDIYNIIKLDMVNDLDSTVALKYTYKGISGLGEDGSKVQPIYRYVDPTHVGILDLDASSGSDPGMSGMICPMTKMYGDSFTKYDEPNGWSKEYAKLEKKFLKTQKQGIGPIDFLQPPSKEDYYNRREIIVQEELEINKIVCPVYNLKDPNYSYTQYSADLDKEEEAEIKSLFTITDFDDDDFYDNNMLVED